jgi:hypothetical protein
LKYLSFTGTKFNFSGRSSDEFGISLVSMDTMIKRPFGMKRTINKEKIRHRDTPYYFESDKETYSLNIVISKIDDNNTVWTQEDKLNISRWLFTSDGQYHEFESEDNSNVLYFLQFTDSTLNSTRTDEAFIELTAEMKFPFAVTIPTYQTFDLSDNTTTTIIEIENKSNAVEYYNPLIECELKGDSTGFKIKNLSFNGEEMSFTNLNQNEILCIDTENQQILSNTGNQRIDKFNFVFTKLVYGINRLEITGKCILTFKCSFPIMV